VIIEVEVRDSAGNAVNEARIDLDYYAYKLWHEYELKKEEVLVGSYDENSFYGDQGYNAVTNKDGYCKLDVKEQKYRIRAAKYLWLNKDGKCDWTEFKEWEGTNLTYTIYIWWIWTDVRVIDEKEQPVKNARIDIDYKNLTIWDDFDAKHDFDSGDIYRGRLEKEQYMREPYNVVTDDKGTAGFFVWKRGCKSVDCNDLPNWYRFRAAKEDYLNEKGDEDWGAFTEREVSVDTRNFSIVLRLVSQKIPVYVDIVDQAERLVPYARCDVDVNFTWDPKWYEYGKFKHEDVTIGEIDRTVLYGDGTNIKTNEYGHTEFYLYRKVDGKTVEKYGFRSAHPNYENPGRKFDWTKRIDVPITRETKEIRIRDVLNKPCDWGDPITYETCIPKVPWYIWVIGGTAVVAAAAVGSYTFVKMIGEKL